MILILESAGSGLMIAINSKELFNFNKFYLIISLNSSYFLSQIFLFKIIKYYYLLSLIFLYFKYQKIFAFNLVFLNYFFMNLFFVISLFYKDSINCFIILDFVISFKNDILIINYFNHYIL